MSFFDPHVAGDRNPDEENPYFIHICALVLVMCAVVWLFVDALMLRIVLAGAVIGLITAIATRGIRVVDADGPPAADRGAAQGASTQASTPLVGDPLRVLRRPAGQRPAAVPVRPAPQRGTDQ